MAKNGKNKKRAKSKMTLPMGIVVPVAAIAYFESRTAMSGPGGVAQVVKNFTGVENGKFTGVDSMKGIYVPLAVGFGAHYLASKSGFNAALGKAKIPLFRI